MLAEVPLRSRGVLRITREASHGHAVVDLRRWFTSGSGEARPGREGSTVRSVDLDALLAALERVRGRMARARVAREPFEPEIAAHGAAVAAEELL